MAPRLAAKRAVVVGAGQTPGETIGNGRATAILFAREGATVLCVDRVLERAEETAALIAAEGGSAIGYEADITDEVACQALALAAKDRLGRIDILHNNVGIGGRDNSLTRLEAEVFDRIMTTNLRAMRCRSCANRAGAARSSTYRRWPRSLHRTSSPTACRRPA